MTLAAEQRWAIWGREGGYCGICGDPVSYREMDVDHILPRSQGGTDELRNLRPAHRTCNRGTSLSSPRIAKWWHPSMKAQATLRLSEAVYRAARQDAEAEGVSLNAWIERAMKETADREAADADPPSR